MKFASPSAFLLLIPVAIFVLRMVLRRRESFIGYSAMDEAVAVGATWRTRICWLPPVLHVAALVLLVIAIARPQQEKKSNETRNQGIAIQLVVDVSSSMDFNIDFAGKSTSRLEVAKRVIEEFVLGNGKDLDGRPNDLLGVLTFARYADTICPLTTGHQGLVHITNELVVNDRPNEDGTAFGDATSLAAARLKLLEDEPEDPNVFVPGQGVKSKIIILLTDGENNCGSHLPLQAAAMAQEWGIKIYTISLGEKEKARKIKTDDGVVKVATDLTSTAQLLSRMSEMTGGIFRTAYDFESLQAVYREIDKLEKSEVKTMPYVEYQDVFIRFALTAAALAALGLTLRNTVLRGLP